MTPTEFHQARKSLGLTQTEMAHALGFSRPAHISDMERGRWSITQQTALLVQAYLDGWRPRAAE